jgi:hypothetical protein
VSRALSARGLCTETEKEEKKVPQPLPPTVVQGDVNVEALLASIEKDPFFGREPRNNKDEDEDTPLGRLHNRLKIVNGRQGHSSRSNMSKKQIVSALTADVKEALEIWRTIDDEKLEFRGTTFAMFARICNLAGRHKLVHQVWKLNATAETDMAGNFQLYSELIKAAAAVPDPDLAVDLLDRMVSDDAVKPHQNNFTGALIALARAHQFDRAEAQFDHVYENGFKIVPTVYYQLTMSAIGCGNMEKACKYMSDLQDSDATPAVKTKSLSYLVEEAVNSKDKENPFAMVLPILEASGKLPDMGTTAAMMNVAIARGDFSVALQIWDMVTHQGTVFDDVGAEHWNAYIHARAASGASMQEGLGLVNSAVACGVAVSPGPLAEVAKIFNGSTEQLDGAYYWLAEVKEAGEPIPAEALDCILIACRQTNDLDRAFDTYSRYAELCSPGQTPGRLAYRELVRVCCSKPGGAELNAAIAVLRLMKENGLSLDAHLVDLYCNALVSSKSVKDRTKQALRFLEKTHKVDGVRPHKRTLVRVLNLTAAVRPRADAEKVKELLVGHGYTMDKHHADYIEKLMVVNEARNGKVKGKAGKAGKAGKGGKGEGEGGGEGGGKGGGKGGKKGGKGKAGPAAADGYVVHKTAAAAAEGSYAVHSTIE